MPKLLRWIMGAPVRRSLRQAVERLHRGSVDWAGPSLSRTRWNKKERCNARYQTLDPLIPSTWFKPAELARFLDNRPLQNLKKTQTPIRTFSKNSNTKLPFSKTKCECFIKRGHYYYFYKFWKNKHFWTHKRILETRTYFLERKHFLNYSKNWTGTIFQISKQNLETRTTFAREHFFKLQNKIWKNEHFLN